MSNFLAPQTPLENWKRDDLSVQDFWQWAYSDLKANNVRGVFSEWLVAQILGLTLSEPRDSWAENDLELPNGKTIEIKSSAYLQTWEQENKSKISFGGLKAQVYDYKTRDYNGISAYNPDIYIFCVQVETNPDIWNALDVTQWRFYVLSNAQMVQHNTKSISLSVVQKLTQELTVNELKDNVNHLSQ